MKCPKCGLDLDGKHAPEYYSGCRRCSALIQRSRLPPGKSWRAGEDATPLLLKGDSFCKDCGKLLHVPTKYCLACESRRKTAGTEGRVG